MTEPTIGRIVHYHAPEAEASNGTQLFAAMVTRVWSETCVNLTVYPDGGNAYFRTSVEIQGRHQGADRSWSWPPRV